jgi:hypothetical protein
VAAEGDVIHRFLRLEHGLAGLVGLALAATGCGAAEPKDSFDQQLLAQANGTAPVGDTPKASGDGSGSSTKEAKEDDLNDAQKGQMEVALRRGGDKSAQCFGVTEGAVAGEGEVKVTFDGKKGHTVDATVPAPWAGTPAEGCIKRAFIGEMLVPFDGTLEVPYTIKLGPKAGAAKTKDPKKK